jgi:hypothetical protein
MPLGIFMELRLEQAWNADPSTFKIPSGRVTVVMPEQPQKANLSIVVTFSGITSLVILVQPLKADLPI